MQKVTDGRTIQTHYTESRSTAAAKLRPYAFLLALWIQEGAGFLAQWARDNNDAKAKARAEVALRSLAARVGSDGNTCRSAGETLERVVRYIASLNPEYRLESDRRESVDRIATFAETLQKGLGDTIRSLAGLRGLGELTASERGSLHNRACGAVNALGGQSKDGFLARKKGEGAAEYAARRAKLAEVNMGRSPSVMKALCTQTPFGEVMCEVFLRWARAEASFDVFDTIMSGKVKASAEAFVWSAKDLTMAIRAAKVAEFKFRALAKGLYAKHLAEARALVANARDDAECEAECERGFARLIEYRSSLDGGVTWEDKVFTLDTKTDPDRSRRGGIMVFTFGAAGSAHIEDRLLRCASDRYLQATRGEGGDDGFRAAMGEVGEWYALQTRGGDGGEG